MLYRVFWDGAERDTLSLAVLWFAIYRTGRDFVCPGLIRRISLPNRTVVVKDHPSNWSVTQLLLSALAHRFHSGGKSFGSRNFGPAERVYVCEKKTVLASFKIDDGTEGR